MNNFKNAPNTHWNKETEIRLRETLTTVRTIFLNETFITPLILGGKECYTKEIFVARNPSNTKEILARVSFANENEAHRAAEHARTHSDLQLWGRMSFEERGKIFENLAIILERKRFFFIALMMLEVGKTAEECDVEISEAIDMIHYYSESAIALLAYANTGIQNPAGEKNYIELHPPEKVPIALIIPPWNFPLAIALGMISGALISGYSVIFKPAEEASVVGYFLANLFFVAGVPRGILQFVPGHGEIVGRLLVEHPLVKVIGFTGSAAVAREIAFSIAKFNYEIAPKLPLSECSEKRFVTKETGGNNALIIDRSTDIQEVVPFIIHSMVSGAGQKCSALQRLIVVDDDVGTYARIVKSLQRAVQEIHVGSPDDLGNVYGPVISASAYTRINNLLELAIHVGAVITKGSISSHECSRGYFVAPFLIEGLLNEHPLVQEEMFAPGLFILRAQTIEDAVAMANNAPYGLTGGLCTRNETYKEYVRKNLDVVNYYENRSITGAVVGRQPFGGHGKSSAGFKAGGLFYLLNFLGERVKSINTMRQGVPLEL